MKLKQHREDVKTLKELNCQGIAGRYHRLVLAVEHGLKWNRIRKTDIEKYAGPRLKAVLKDAKTVPEP